MDFCSIHSINNSSENYGLCSSFKLKEAYVFSYVARLSTETRTIQKSDTLLTFLPPSSLTCISAATVRVTFLKIVHHICLSSEWWFLKFSFLFNHYDLQNSYILVSNHFLYCLMKFYNLFMIFSFLTNKWKKISGDFLRSDYLILF